jgi:hypothetical protein
MQNGKKNTTHTWNARTPYGCIADLVTLSQQLQVALGARFKNIVPSTVKKLGKVFDLEHAVEQLCRFKIEDGKLMISREDWIEWEANGSSEFGEFYRNVCMLPHVQALPKLGNCTDTMFSDRDGKSVLEFKQSHLTALSAVNEDSLDTWFELCFASGAVVMA